MSALLLFDIDGTLLLSGGAGMRAMSRAFEELFGIADAFTSTAVAGRTDTFLVSAALTHAGLPDTPDMHARFRDAYLRLLPIEIQQRGIGKKQVMPGVEELLVHVDKHDGYHSALLTGNYEVAAHIKLAHFGLSKYFSWGAFGDDSFDRNALARLALARAADRGIPDAARRNVVVIGDTPHDIEAARAIGARIIAVATGGFSMDELREADAVFEDLTETEQILRVAEAPGSRTQPAP